jgi:hypothetical protein
MKTALYLFAGYAVAFIAMWLIGGFVLLDWDVRNWSNGGRFTVAWLSLFGVLGAVFAKPTP